MPFQPTPMLREGGDCESGKSSHKSDSGPSFLEEMVHYKHINEEYQTPADEGVVFEEQSVQHAFLRVVRQCSICKAYPESSGCKPMSYYQDPCQVRRKQQGWTQTAEPRRSSAVRSSDLTLLIPRPRHRCPDGFAKSRSARVASGAFYCAFYLGDFLQSHHPLKWNI